MRKYFEQIRIRRTEELNGKHSPTNCVKLPKSPSDSFFTKRVRKKTIFNPCQQLINDTVKFVPISIEMSFYRGSHITELLLGLIAMRISLIAGDCIGFG